MTAAGVLTSAAAAGVGYLGCWIPAVVGIWLAFVAIFYGLTLTATTAHTIRTARSDIALTTLLRTAARDVVAGPHRSSER